jgi:hypothetical protein
LLLVCVLAVCTVALQQLVSWFRKPDANVAAAANPAGPNPAPQSAPQPVRPTAPEISPATSPAIVAAQPPTLATEEAAPPSESNPIPPPAAPVEPAPPPVGAETPAPPDDPPLPESAPPSATAAAANSPSAPREWKRADGKTLRATLLVIQGDKVQLRVAPGSDFWYPVERLSADDRLWLLENFPLLAAGSVEVDWEARAWKSRSGKFETTAVFLRQQGSVVSLLNHDGRVLQVELQALSPDDQTYLSGR